jgi:hypothetical protein
MDKIRADLYTVSQKEASAQCKRVENIYKHNLSKSIKPLYKSKGTLNCKKIQCKQAMDEEIKKYY